MAERDPELEVASEIEYLRWYRRNIDFGPAHEDVIDIMDEAFVKETGKEVPWGWRIGDEDLERPKADRPWWFPVLSDAEWIRRIRDDYEDAKEHDDETLRDIYADGRKYAVTWDHIGDAYDEYEKLADAYLELLGESK